MTDKIKKIGFAMCGSFCTHKTSLEILKRFCEKYDVYPILSENVYSTSTRFGECGEFIKNVSALTGKKVVHTVKEAEKFGPSPLDGLIICPCTGNTLAKIANGITDTSVTMAAKATLRSNSPVVIALSTNDGLGGNFSNLGLLYNRKNVYFVPMSEDDCEKKPYSLICDFSRAEECMEYALVGKQVLPLFYH